MENEHIESLKTLLLKPKTAVIIPHKNPDGDALGSCLALHHYLVKRGHDSVVISPNDFPHFLKWLPGSEDVIIFEGNKDLAKKLIGSAKLIFCLDFNDPKRTEGMEQLIEASKAVKILIDHHPEPVAFSDLSFSDSGYGSTSEMVYNILSAMGDANYIDQKLSTCLYTGIMTDSGSFRYPNTTGDTHRIAGELIDRGASNVEIHQKIFDSYSVNRMKLLGKALDNMVVLPELHTAYTYLTKEELKECGSKKGDTEGFVNFGLALDNIRLSVIFIEYGDEPYIKISLRSKGDFSVNDLAREHFRGGGHTNAAGGKSDKNISSSIKNFVSVIKKYKKQLTQSSE